eukprot:scpid53749/ scgid9446/ 
MARITADPVLAFAAMIAICLLLPSGTEAGRSYKNGLFYHNCDSLLLQDAAGREVLDSSEEASPFHITHNMTCGFQRGKTYEIIITGRYLSGFACRVQKKGTTSLAKAVGTFPSRLSPRQTTTSPCNPPSTGIVGLQYDRTTRGPLVLKWLAPAEIDEDDVQVVCSLVQEIRDSNPVFYQVQRSGPIEPVTADYADDCTSNSGTKSDKERVPQQSSVKPYRFGHKFCDTLSMGAPNASGRDLYSIRHNIGQGYTLEEKYQVLITGEEFSSFVCRVQKEGKTWHKAAVGSFPGMDSPAHTTGVPCYPSKRGITSLRSGFNAPLTLVWQAPSDRVGADLQIMCTVVSRNGEQYHVKSEAFTEKKVATPIYETGVSECGGYQIHSMPDSLNYYEAQSDCKQAGMALLKMSQLKAFKKAHCLKVSSSWLSWGKKYGRIIPTPKEIKVQLKSIQRASKSNDKRLEKLRTDLGNTLTDLMRDEKTNFICVKDINECETTPDICVGDGTGFVCKNTIGSYTCVYDEPSSICVQTGHYIVGSQGVTRHAKPFFFKNSHLAAQKSMTIRCQGGSSQPKIGYRFTSGQDFTYPTEAAQVDERFELEDGNSALTIEVSKLNGLYGRSQGMLEFACQGGNTEVKKLSLRVTRSGVAIRPSDQVCYEE